MNRHTKEEREETYARLSAECDTRDALSDRIRLQARSWLAPVVYFTVTRDMVGEPHPLGGRFLVIDVGKRVVMDCGVVQIENNEQLAARKQKQG